MEGVREAIRKGDALAKASGSLEQSLCYFQDVDFRKLTPKWEFIRDRKELIEEFADAMMGEMRIGVTSSYLRPPPMPPGEGAYHIRKMIPLKLRKLYGKILHTGECSCVASNQLVGIMQISK